MIILAIVYYFLFQKNRAPKSAARKSNLNEQPEKASRPVLFNLETTIISLTLAIYRKNLMRDFYMSISWLLWDLIKKLFLRKDFSVLSIFQKTVWRQLLFALCLEQTKICFLVLSLIWIDLFCYKFWEPLSYSW